MVLTVLPKLCFMKTINTSSLYILYVPLKKNLLKEKEQKNDRSNPHSYRVGINFANISAGNLYRNGSL